MNQSRTDSLMEALVNIGIGLIISTVANIVLLGVILGFPMTLAENLLISGVFTVISLVRSYAIRRAFNGRSVWAALKEKLNARKVPHGPDPEVGDCIAWDSVVDFASLRVAADLASERRTGSRRRR